MLISKEETVVIFTRESAVFKDFSNKFFETYSNYKEDNLILNLFSLDKLKIEELLEFLEVSNKHRNNKKSFVLVTDALHTDDIPESLVVVPTVQEAIDLIEMEEIERDLDF
ncbi:ribonuclease Z [Ascidiimonas sp. W6]|uniref:ribonuclease Z n=1 Tax=Ascidiimonas meishanensis TaxID=3128903 RepID=UPI0030ED5ED6